MTAVEIEKCCLLDSTNNSGTERMLSRDWRKALRTPHIYRVGNSTLRIQNQFIIFIIVAFIVMICLYGYPLLHSVVCVTDYHKHLPPCGYYTYNKTYPMTTPIQSAGAISYAIAMVSDLDTDSKVAGQKETWRSILQKGHLTWMPANNLITVSWDDEPITLTSSLSMKGRGMELSELVTFDGKLLTFDDRTGIIFRIEENKVFPWIILMDANGKSSKGFKSEWATVKDEQLYVGSMGKEWTTAFGDFVSNDPMWVKVVSPRGETHSLNWVYHYTRLRQAINIEFPGYMLHESGVWSDVHQKWFFLPRRCSQEKYNETKDEVMACNVMLSCDENFHKIEVKQIGERNPIRGFSSFKFLPGSQDSIIVALKSEEYKGQTATYITAFTIDGNIIMQDVKTMNIKFEGLEFI